MDAKTIYNNRLSFAKKLVNRDVFSLDIYSKYFEIPRSEALKDLKAIGIKNPEDVESKNPIQLKLLIGKRQQILEKEGYSENALGEMGFWYRPSNKIAEFSTAIDAAINYYQTERSRTGPYNIKFSTICDKYDLKYDDFKREFHNRSVLKYDERILHDKKDELTVLISKSTVDDTSKLTGVDKVKLYDISRELSAEYMLKHSNLLVEHTPNKNAYRKQELMKKVWDMYNEHGSTHGMTQKEIADKLGLTRETVSHYITAYKKQHPEVIDVTQLYQPHHLGEEKTKQREIRKKIVADAYKCGASVEQISKTFKIRREAITKYLKEDGLIVAHAKTVENPKQFGEAVKEAKVGYEEQGQFGAYKVNVEGNKTLFHGATSRLLDEMGAPAYTTNFNERTRLRDGILRNQQDTMAMLRNNPDALNEFVRTNGEARTIISAQNLIARQKMINEDKLNEQIERAESDNLIDEEIVL